MNKTICCPGCVESGIVTEEMEGKEVKCSKCSTKFVVKTVQNQPPAAPARIPDDPVLPTAPKPTTLPRTETPTPAKPVLPVEPEPEKRSVEWWRDSVIVRAIRQWFKSSAATFGAATAFYAVFAIVPLLFLVIIAWGYIRGGDAAFQLAKEQYESKKRLFDDEKDAAKKESLEKELEQLKLAFDDAEKERNKTDAEISAFLERWLGPKFGKKAAPILLALSTEIRSYLKGKFAAHQFTALMVTIAFHIASVLALFIQIRMGVCVIWKIQPANSFALICFDYLLALALVWLTALSVLLSLVLGAWGDNPDSPFPGGEALSFIILTLALFFTFRLLSAYQRSPKEDILVVHGWSMAQVRRLLFRLLYGEGISFRVSWQAALFGSLLTSGLFLLGKKLLQYYLFEYILDSDLYVRGGLLIIFLLWVYYCSQIFFLGAELIQARMTQN